MMPMRKYCLPVLGLLTWLMMMPPPKMPLVKDAHGDYEVNTGAPMAKWLVYATYRNEAACRGDLKDLPGYFKCVDSGAGADTPSAKKATLRPR
jgi:hypothetical protein